MVRGLLQTVGLPVRSCLNLRSFLEVLKLAHERGRGPTLNKHWRPQQFWCFRKMAPGQWTEAAPISTPGFASRIASAFGDQSRPEFPHGHASHGHAPNITAEECALLNDITRTEYEALGLSMPTGCAVVA